MWEYVGANMICETALQNQRFIALLWHGGSMYGGDVFCLFFLRNGHQTVWGFLISADLAEMLAELGLSLKLRGNDVSSPARDRNGPKRWLRKGESERWRGILIGFGSVTYYGCSMIFMHTFGTLILGNCCFVGWQLHWLHCMSFQRIPKTSMLIAERHLFRPRSKGLEFSCNLRQLLGLSPTLVLAGNAE